MGGIVTKLGMRSNYKSLTREIINTIELCDFNKLILKKRYVQMMEHLDKKRAITRFWYGIFTFVITLGSILVPALISIEDKTFLPPTSNKTTYVSIDSSSNNITDTPQPQVITTEEIMKIQSYVLFWTTFVISLLVTICNALMKLYSIDKIYIIRHLKYDELRREGWFFYTLTGEYTKYNTNNAAFRLFITRIEAIKSMLLHDELTPEYNISNIPELRDSLDNDENTSQSHRPSYNVSQSQNQHQLEAQIPEDNQTNNQHRSQSHYEEATL